MKPETIQEFGKVMGENWSIDSLKDTGEELTKELKALAFDWLEQNKFKLHTGDNGMWLCYDTGYAGGRGKTPLEAIINCAIAHKGAMNEQ